MNTFQKVYQLVKKVPQGKVTSYGEIAKKLRIGDVRVIGWALHANRDFETPCHRVVNKKGELAPGYVFGGWQKQKEKLLAEGVCFSGEREVDLKKSGFVFRPSGIGIEKMPS
ncbi:MAG: MGMT family protein [Patescibacteria group bacterium]|nr:MGMT family protein [Patescibacteria group bacterium]